MDDASTISQVEVEKASTRGRVSLIEGSFVTGHGRYRFSGIIVMSVGGPSVGVSLREEDVLKLLSRGVGREQIDGMIAELERRIVEGDFDMKGEVEHVED